MNALRFSLYCHNGEGLGHIVRTLQIARALKSLDASAEVLVITGCFALDRVDWPSGVAQCALPPLDFDERFARKDWTRKIIQRSRMIAEALDTFEPHVLLVDNLPYGSRGELRDVVVRRNPKFLKVLGMPYPYVKPNRAPYPHRPTGGHLYDGIIAYVDPRVYPILDTLPQRERRNADYVGFVADRIDFDDTPNDAGSDRPLVTVLNGGGSRLTILPFLDKVLLPAVEEGTLRLRILTGILSRGEMSARYGGRDGVEMIPRMSAADAARGSDLIFSRCGYNTALAVLQLDSPIIFAPERTMDEQIQRAAAYAALDRVWTIEESPEALACVLPEALGAGRAVRTLELRLDGAATSARWLRDIALRHAAGSDP